MKVLYFDPIVGASGDMILAALIDAGVPISYLTRALRFVPGATLVSSRVQKQGVSARQVRFHITKIINERNFFPLIKKSRLPHSIQDQAKKIISRIFEVERKVHRMKNVHLHELADADTLLDITGTLLAIDYLNVGRILTRPLKAGQGFIKTAEGTMPAFNFATAELLKGFPIDFLPISAELTTPTAAAIISTLAKPASSYFLPTLTTIGIGAGTNSFENYPNLLRVFIGDPADMLEDTCTMIETNIDDMNPQDYEQVFENLYNAGALEVYLTPTIMKHSRPGCLLTILCSSVTVDILDTLFTNTTTLGIRMIQTHRIKLHRQIRSWTTKYGRIRVKHFVYKGSHRFSLEHSDVKRIARKYGRSAREIREELTMYVRNRLSVEK